MVHASYLAEENVRRVVPGRVNQVLDGCRKLVTVARNPSRYPVTDEQRERIVKELKKAVFDVEAAFCAGRKRNFRL
jgi:hypothetical protein